MIQLGFDLLSGQNFNSIPALDFLLKSDHSSKDFWLSLVGLFYHRLSCQFSLI